MIRTLALPWCFAALFAVCAGAATAQQSAPPRAVRAPASQGIFLVFPFESDGANPRLDWLCEGLEELTIQRLSAAGQQVYSHAGRTGELDRSGLPPTGRLSR